VRTCGVNAVKAIAILLWLMAFSAGAQGWNDFTIELEDGYAISRISGFGCILIEPDGQWLVGDKYVGYVEEYALAESYVATRCELDGMSTYYLLTRSDGVLHGPFTAEQFRTNPLLGNGTIPWVKTVRPIGVWAYVGGFVLVLVAILGFVMRVMDRRNEYFSGVNHAAHADPDGLRNFTGNSP